MRGHIATARGVSWMLIAMFCGLVLASCEREHTPAREAAMPKPAPRAQHVDLQPGIPGRRPEIKNPYEGDMQALAEGQQLYAWFNCSGCHFQGGGGIGPPLMDERWIYGSAPANVFATIVEGRPNGMPAYGGHVPDDQVWKIVAYVRSLSGLGPQLPAGARSDALQETASENLKEAPAALKDSLKESK